MISRFKSAYRQLRYFLEISRQKGYSDFSTLFIQLPRAVLSKAYGKISRKINGTRLNALINVYLLKTFHSHSKQASGDHFYMIVMPGMLHFLIPCLNLIPAETRLFLIYNGTRSWEKQYLEKNYPQIPGHRLVTLPGSSISHGDVISIFLNANNRNFGILDHDLYIFDSEIFKKLQMDDKQCMVAVFQGKSDATGFTFPHTFFLFFNTRLLKQIMQRYKVNAGIYRSAPANTKDKLEHIGLKAGVFLKDYHNYFDTLHLMLGLCFTEGLEVKYLDVDDRSGIYHVGGTSMGTHITKDISRSYITMRFLEYVNSPVLNSKYSHLFSKYGSSQKIRPLLPGTAAVSHMLQVLDTIMTKLDTCKAINKKS